MWGIAAIIDDVDIDIVDLELSILPENLFVLRWLQGLEP